MAVEWTIAPQEIVALADELIEAHHPHLRDLNIGLLMRSEASRSGGKEIWGKAKKAGAELRTLLNLDFVIWLAADVWWRLEDNQRRALVDHELTHCGVNAEGAPTMIGHDFEEFTSIVKRHGLWRTALEYMAIAVQPHLVPPEDGERRGRVIPLDPDRMGESWPSAAVQHG